MKDNKLFSNSQHGFREGRSCLSNLLTTLEEWTDILDDKACVDVAYLDFSKAFDLVSHKHLLLKLNKHGINGQIGNWIKAFLQDRSISTKVNGTLSKKRSFTEGIPQGSALSCTLFLIFINDLEAGIKPKIKFFADDTSLYSVVRDSLISV